MTQVAFRADASTAIGTGHVMRCLNLADALTRHGARVRFVCRELPPAVQSVVAARGHAVVFVPDETPAATSAALADAAWDWIVVDHYRLDASWERGLRGASRVMVVDDLADRPHDCDLLLDQNYFREGATRYVGKVPAGCRQLLGPRFALLRPEFASWHARAAVRGGAVRRLLIAFGGVDAANHTLVAIEAVASSGFDGAVDVVIGGAHPAPADVRAACERRGFTLHVQTDHLAALMAAADVSIGAGGVTVWERACLGLPAVAISVADNQCRPLRDAAEAGIVVAPDLRPDAVTAGTLARHLVALIENSALRTSISRQGMAMVDGGGAARVAARLLASGIVMRDVTAADARALFEWRNDPAVRAASADAVAIGWDTHQAWFERVRSNPRQLLLIGERAGQPIGVVRFDIDEDEAEVSIYLVPGVERGSGAGGQLLEAAERRLLAWCPEITRLQARTLPGNLASQRLFASAGYTQEVTWFTRQVRA